MNIEELELSLRTEFESQVRNVLAGIKQDVADFQSKFQAELEEHRTRLDRTVSDLSSRLPESAGFDAAFGESVNEHLRLARDDGAQVAATAFGEAEKLRAEAVPAPVGGFDLIRDAISDISSKNSQATILQALVGHAARFAARGAFFILKNDRFVAWKIFGSKASDESLRDLVFAASNDTVLAASVRGMSKVSGGAGQFGDDSVFMDALQFESPSEMHAIPLTARGRAVAVLYADAGNGGAVNVEALETLLRVAGLTVELLAASQSVPTPTATVSAPAVEADQEVAEVESVPVPEPVVEEAEQVEVEAEPEVAQTPVVEEPAYESASYGEVSFEASAEPVEEYIGEVTYEVEQAEEVPVVEAPQVETFEPVVESESEAEAVSEFSFSSEDSYDASYEVADEVAEPEAAEPEPSVVPVVEAPVAVSLNGHADVATVAEPVVEVAPSEPKRSRFSDRNVDLPIEVAEGERKLHNDARRFARLLVSEIKLYNEQKVTDGRESGNIYEQLKEAIDRSREMYEKRVQPAVASKFDYFHYEVVNSLADGQAANLGAGYPGASV